MAFVGTYLPRRCGIATFTADLCRAVAQCAGSPERAFAVALNDRPEGYDYPPDVRYQIRDGALADYRRAADFLNLAGVEVLSLQHEYGIFGGPAGAYVLELARDARMPVVTTLHTVLRCPDEHQRSVLEQLVRLSDRVVVMAETARTFLREIYGVPDAQVAVIPHGIPDVPFVDPAFYKDKFGVEGRTVLLSFGLLHPGKGIELAIRALPEILARHPDAVYLVAGATHPHVQREQGERYRLGLERLAEELGVAAHVVFDNRFLDLEELCELLGAADLYLTPYLGEEQIVSGTLSYALGAGKAVVSTPYWYAREVLADGRGRLVPFGDAAALGRAVIELLDDPVERHRMRKAAYTFARRMVWPEVARAYLALFAAVKREREAAPRPRIPAPAPAGGPGELPEPDLRHLRTLTDDTGILQHARFTVPDRRHGYSLDDNARAVIAALMAHAATGDDALLGLAATYLAFVEHAWNPDAARFRNFLTYDRRWAETAGSEDSHGRALWGLGYAVAAAPDDGMIRLAAQLFDRALPAVAAFRSPRAWAFALLGADGYLRRYGGARHVLTAAEVLAERLYRQYRAAAAPEWRWFEDLLTYANARLPQALLVWGERLGRTEWTEAGLEALAWLVQVETAPEGHLCPVGNAGWYRRGGERARFDQQPVEVQGLVEAAIAAHRVTGEARWLRLARRGLDWFLGANDIREPLYDYRTGGCRDGLHPDRASGNQGAESTLAWLLALLALLGYRGDLALRRLEEGSVVRTATPEPRSDP